MKGIYIVLVGWLLVACGQPQTEETFSQSGANRPKPTSYIETIEPDGDMSGVRIYNFYPEPGSGKAAFQAMSGEDIQKTTVARRIAQQTAEAIATPTEIGPNYVQEADRVTILIDRYMGDYDTTPRVPVSLGQNVYLRAETQFLKHSFTLAYDETFFALVYEDPTALSFTLQPLKSGQTRITLERNHCDNCPYFQAFHSMYIPVEITP